MLSQCFLKLSSQYPFAWLDFKLYICEDWCVLYMLLYVQELE